MYLTTPCLMRPYFNILLEGHIWRVCLTVLKLFLTTMILNQHQQQFILTWPTYTFNKLSFILFYTLLIKYTYFAFISQSKTYWKMDVTHLFVILTSSRETKKSYYILKRPFGMSHEKGLSVLQLAWPLRILIKYIWVLFHI